MNWETFRDETRKEYSALDSNAKREAMLGLDLILDNHLDLLDGGNRDRENALHIRLQVLQELILGE